MIIFFIKQYLVTVRKLVIYQVFDLSGRSGRLENVKDEASKGRELGPRKLSGFDLRTIYFIILQSRRFSCCFIV